MSWVLVFGATSRIGQHACHELAKMGHDLVLVGRDPRELEAVAGDVRIREGVATRAVEIDALDLASHASTLDDVLAPLRGELAGALWLIGMLGDQEVARSDAALAARIVETNFTAAVSMLTPVAEVLEAQGRGFLGIVSSVAGDRGRQSNYVYGAAKGGLSLFAQGLRNRLQGTGVTVTTVKPGFVDTKMTYGSEDMFLVASPERIARATVKATARGRSVAYAPWFWRPVLWIIRSIPEWLFKRLNL